VNRRLAMTVEEATVIRRQAQRGALDMALPGTDAIVRDAERTCARADLWGSTREDRRHSLVAATTITVTTALIVVVCMLPLPL
jgi:hypothetical protein